mmetsp:Transcript_46016/g.106587  ORF Transcript_46016/g.106587 Transcript_46016/m.106587 type:complete len:104 (+) Transcript_46016:286-597(+)
MVNTTTGITHGATIKTYLNHGTFVEISTKRFSLTKSKERAKPAKTISHLKKPRGTRQSIEAGIEGAKEYPHTQINCVKLTDPTSSPDTNTSPLVISGTPTRHP